VRGSLHRGIASRLRTAPGHKRRFRDVRDMSALPPILTVTADIADRRFGATSGCEQSQQTNSLLSWEGYGVQLEDLSIGKPGEDFESAFAAEMTEIRRIK
jgi:hypothetical protein